MIVPFYINNMRKFICLIFVSWLIMLSASGQDNYLDMRMGAGIPVKDFAENGPDDKGYAGSGFMMSFEGNMFLGKIGIVGSATYGMNYLDDVALRDDLTDHMKEEFSGIVIPPDATVQYVTTQWNNVNLMAGPVLSIPLSVFQVELRALGGVSFVMPPEWQLDISYDNSKLHAVSSGQSVKLAYLAGAGILYHASGKYGIRLGVDYIGTNTRFGVTYRYEEVNTTNSHADVTMEIPVTMFQTTLGLAYYF